MESTAVADVTKTGAFDRKPSTFRRAFDDHGAHPPARGRYVLHVSLACPWAHRALIARALKGLEDAIDVRVTSPVWARTRPDLDDDAHCGWVFTAPGERRRNPAGRGWFVADANCASTGAEGATTIRALYDAVGAPKEQRFTVPLMWDVETRDIVNNESSDILRELNVKFNRFARRPEVDLYPESTRARVDEVNEWIYEKINNGVYKCGFATSQEAYEEAARALFDALDECERILSRSRYIAGDALTEADVRLFVTLIRFDEVYVVYFKTNKKFIHQYEHLSGYVRELYQMPEFRETTSFKHIKEHYFASHPPLNPHAIVPVGPDVDLDAPHGRDGAYPR